MEKREREVGENYVQCTVKDQQPGSWYPDPQVLVLVLFTLSQHLHHVLKQFPLLQWDSNTSYMEPGDPR